MNSSRNLEARARAAAGRVGGALRRVGRAVRRRPGRSLLLLVAVTVLYTQCLSPPPWVDADAIPPPSLDQRSLSAGPAAWGAPGGDEGVTGVTTASPSIDAPLAWSVALDESAHGLIASERSVFVVVDEAREVRALEAATGAVRWSVMTQGPPDRSPALAGDLIYVQVRGSGMLALDVESGHVVWRDRSNQPLTATPNVAAGIVWAGKRGHLAALDAETGEELARRGIDGKFVKLRVALGPEHVVIAKPDTLLFVRRSNGQRVFEARFPDVSYAAIVGETVIAASDRQLVAFDANSGLPWWDGIRDWWFRLHVYAGFPALPAPPNLWVQRTRCELLAPVVTAERVVAACEEGTVRSHLLETGEVLWERELGGLTADPILTARGLLLATPDGLLLLDPEDGDEVDRRPLDGRAVRELAVTSDAVYILTEDGEIVALR